MEKYEDAFRRVKQLECPTGELEERIQEIISSYHVANANDIRITRKEGYDRDGAQAYRVDFSNQEGNFSKTVIAKSGTEDYVVKVLDVF